MFVLTLSVRDKGNPNEPDKLLPPGLTSSSRALFVGGEYIG